MSVYSQTSELPHSLDTLCVELTVRCPLRCVHCSAFASPTRTQSLPTSILLEQIRSLPHLQELYLSGGEPFEYHDFLEVVAAGRELANTVVAYSSGTRLDGSNLRSLTMDELRAAQLAGLNRLDLSLYADEPALHDCVTKRPGSFDRTLATARLAAALGLSLRIHFVPIHSSAIRVRATAVLSRALGAERLHVLALTPQGRAEKQFAELTAESEFWRELKALMAEMPDYVILSSVLRRALGDSRPTERDAYRTGFLDSQGYLHAGEGRRVSPSGALSILKGHTIADLAQLAYAT